MSVTLRWKHLISDPRLSRAPLPEPQGWRWSRGSRLCRPPSLSEENVKQLVFPASDRHTFGEQVTKIRGCLLLQHNLAYPG